MNNKPKHTPGPTSYIGDLIKLIKLLRDPKIVNLLAAAPELLAALLKARESLLGMKELLNSHGSAYGLGLTWKMIDEAIAKAEQGK